MMIKIFTRVTKISGVALMFTILLLTFSSADPLIAASCNQSTTNPRIDNGLISSGGSISNQFTSKPGSCVVDTKAIFGVSETGNFGFDSLKSTYYFQTPASTTVNKHSPLGAGDQSVLIFDGTKKHIYSITGDLTIGAVLPASSVNPGVVFVDGNLRFSNVDYKYGYNDKTRGTIFVVGGDVIVDTTVKEINAFIIASGNIKTGGDTCITKSSVSTSNPLTVFGSLVSVNESKPIIFCRKLLDNSLASEIINYEAKYLVLFKDIFGKTINISSEK